MGTPLQEIYESFFIKTNEDFTYKEDQVFKYFTTAIGKSYKTVPSKLDFSLNSNEIVLTIFAKSELGNNISISINDDLYEIPILADDTLVNIADKIKTALELDYIVELNLSKYPRLIISSESVEEIKYSISYNEGDTLDLEFSKTYSGNMTSDLYYDEIELISMFMQLEHYIKIKSELEKLKIHIGTKDFNKLPDKRVEYSNINSSIKDLDERIFKFRQEFYEYRGGL